MPHTVHVDGISPATSKKEVGDFFSFCGKISSYTLTPASGEENAPQSATVIFEKDAAAETALLLDQTQFGDSVVSVKAAADINELAGDSPQHVEDNADHAIVAQEDKPRSRILAEYLAYGYKIGDDAIDRAIQLDTEYGISERFTSALKNFDKKYNVTGRAKGLDQQHEITTKAASGWQELGQYFEKKRLENPSGPDSRIRKFYKTTTKQIIDVHREARRLADLKQGKTESPAESAAVPSQSESGPEIIPVAAPSQPEAATAPAPAPAPAAAPVDPKA